MRKRSPISFWLFKFIFGRNEWALNEHALLSTTRWNKTHTKRRVLLCWTPQVNGRRRGQLAACGRVSAALPFIVPCNLISWPFCQQLRRNVVIDWLLFFTFSLLLFPLWIVMQISFGFYSILGKLGKIQVNQIYIF